MDMIVWTVLAKSCNYCNRMSIGTFYAKPTKKEIESVIDKCDGLDCIHTYIQKSIIGKEAVNLDTSKK